MPDALRSTLTLCLVLSACGGSADGSQTSAASLGGGDDSGGGESCASCGAPGSGTGHGTAGSVDDTGCVPPCDDDDGGSDETGGGVDVPCNGDRYWDPSKVATLSVPDSTTGKTYYVDGDGGSDENDGTSFDDAFATIGRAVEVVAAGDTVRIGAGFYREGIRLVGVSGTSTQPITFGPYGNGEVILDGSPEVTGWTPEAGTVWSVPLTFTPVAVVVDATPLKEVSHGQTALVPEEGPAGVTSGSGKWYFDPDTQVLHADMGAVLGDGDPNDADVIVPEFDGAQEHVYWYDAAYLRFYGLTVRGSGAGGIWGYGDSGHVTVEWCNVQFNGKGGVIFPAGEGNAVLTSHVYHNVLQNWPRGNNENTGGGWPSAIGGYGNLGMVARGNVVHRNGGEGILTYGSEAGLQTGGVIVEDNVVFDNWSVNVYIDNQPDCIVRRNLIYDHAPDFADLLADNDYMREDVGRKLTPQGVMLADEEWSSDASNGNAHLAGTQVYANIIASCKVGIRDYAEGENAEANHGLIDTLIANNTIILPQYESPDYNAGIQILDNGDNNSGTRIVNNIVLGFGVGQLVVLEQPSGLTGVELDHNVYFAPGAGFRLGEALVDFAGFRAAYPELDAASVFADPLLAAPDSYAGAGLFDPSGVALDADSPALGHGETQSAFAEDFFGVAMHEPWDAGAVQGGDPACGG